MKLWLVPLALASLALTACSQTEPTCTSCCVELPPVVVNTDEQSPPLRYTLTYQPPTDHEAASLTATLTNVSGRDLLICGHPAPQLFDASFDVSPPTGEPYVLMDREYLRLITMVHFVPNIESVAAGQTMTWRLPIESLETTIDFEAIGDSITINPEDLFDKFGIQATPESLAGCRISSTLTLSVSTSAITPGAGILSEDFTLTSNAVEIPSSTQP